MDSIISACVIYWDATLTFIKKCYKGGNMRHFRDKDQGYAWVVMAAAFVGNMINSGFFTGVYFNAY